MHTRLCMPTQCIYIHLQTKYIFNNNKKNFNENNHFSSYVIVSAWKPGRCSGPQWWGTASISLQFTAVHRSDTFLSHVLMVNLQHHLGITSVCNYGGILVKLLFVEPSLCSRCYDNPNVIPGASSNREFIPVVHPCSGHPCSGRPCSCTYFPSLIFFL